MIVIQRTKCDAKFSHVNQVLLKRYIDVIKTDAMKWLMDHLSHCMSVTQSKINDTYTRDTFNYNKVMMKLFILESDDKVLDDLNTAEFDKKRNMQMR